MSDIKYIFLDDKKYQKKAEYFSNKYQVPISIKKPTNCHIALSSKLELCFKNEKFASDFTKGRFFTRLSKHQTELRPRPKLRRRAQTPRGWGGGAKRGASGSPGDAPRSLGIPLNP